MSVYPRDLAALEHWDASLARSRERRQRAAKGRPLPASSMPLSTLLGATARDLSDLEPWELSLGRSRTRRRAQELRFVPTSTRFKRISLGALVALSAGPTAALGEASAASQGSGPAPEPTPTTTEHVITLSEGSEGRQVRLLQQALGIQADGIYGPETEEAVRNFQASHGLTVDGIAGPQTTAALRSDAPFVASSSSARAASVSDSQSETTQGAGAGSNVSTDVMRLQEALHISADGDFGPETEAAVRRLQETHNLTVDGIVGPETWNAVHLPQGPTLNPPHSALASQAKASASHHHAGAHIASVSTSSDSGSASKSEYVMRLQEALHISADGDFGPETEAAVRRLQETHNLTVDGIVGPETWNAVHLPQGPTLNPPHAATTSSSSSTGESSVVARVIAAANEIATTPYVYGGGHGSFQSTGYDCSGSVSYALHGGGLLSAPEDSSELESYGEAGPGKYITIYANAEHAWMVIDGRRFDTIAQQETGTRWSDSISSSSGYVVRHPAGL